MFRKAKEYITRFDKTDTFITKKTYKTANKHTGEPFHKPGHETQIVYRTYTC